MALLEKTALCPWEAAAKSAVQKKEEVVSNGAAETPAPDQPPPVRVFEPSQKKRKFFGFREDPFVYIQVLFLDIDCTTGSDMVCIQTVHW